MSIRAVKEPLFEALMEARKLIIGKPLLMDPLSDPIQMQHVGRILDLLRQALDALEPNNFWVEEVPTGLTPATTFEPEGK